MSTKDYIEKDYYASLGVTKDASPQDIKKTYRKLARDLHPDKNPGDAESEARFKEVSEAYDVLSDPAKRKEYDEARELFVNGGYGGFRPGRTSDAGGAGGFDVNDLFGGGSSSNINDLFDGLFGANAGRSRTRTTGPGPTRGKDMTSQITIGFEEAVRGATLPLRLSGPATCTLCHGSGAKPGTQPRTCPTCHGSGFVSSNQGAFGFSEPCRDCRGTGTSSTTPVRSAGAPVPRPRPNDQRPHTGRYP